jgi:hypothetical protein
VELEIPKMYYDYYYNLKEKHADMAIDNLHYDKAIPF